MPPAEPTPDTPALPASGTVASARVLVLVAHPQMELSRANRGLMTAAARRPTGAEGSADVQVRDLYAIYPDYVIDVDRERAALKAADLIVWQHPIHWYGPTPLLKLWMDDVLGFGWAYGPGGTALQGKDLWIVITTGGPEPSYQPDGYNRYSFDTFLPPYEQTAALCGMRFLPPLVVHGAHRLSADEIATRGDAYARRLWAYPAWARAVDGPDPFAPAVPSEARRADGGPVSQAPATEVPAAAEARVAVAGARSAAA